MNEYLAKIDNLFSHKLAPFLSLYFFSFETVTHTVIPLFHTIVHTINSIHSFLFKLTICVHEDIMTQTFVQPMETKSVNLHDLPKVSFSTESDDIKVRSLYIRYCIEREWLPEDYVDTIY